jgi:hypothetical protein
MTNSKYFLYCLLPTIVIIFLPIGIYRVYMDKLLEENGVYTEAIIYRFSHGKVNGSKPYFCYYYAVDGTIYKDRRRRHLNHGCCTIGSGLIRNCAEYKGFGRWYRRSDTLSVGDTIIIIYNKKNPSHSVAKRDFKRW